jgi:hypothetical protein
LEQFANETAAQALSRIDDQLKEFGVEGGLEEVNQKVEEMEQVRRNFWKYGYPRIPFFHFL